MKNTEPDLPSRQLDVLRGVASGKTVAEIADEIGRSTKTVEYHWGKVAKRLRLRSKVHAAHYALSHNLIPSLFMLLMLCGCSTKRPAPKPPSPQLVKLPKVVRVSSAAAPIVPRTNNLVVHWPVTIKQVDATHWKLPASTSLEVSNDLVHWKTCTNIPIKISPYPADGFTVAVPTQDSPFKFLRTNDHYE